MRGNPTEQPFNVDAKVLFPEVQEIPVIERPSKTSKEPAKVGFCFDELFFQAHRCKLVFVLIDVELFSL
jgi:hypothetical protein